MPGKRIALEIEGERERCWLHECIGKTDREVKGLLLSTQTLKY